MKSVLSLSIIFASIFTTDNRKTRDGVSFDDFVDPFAYGRGLLRARPADICAKGCDSGREHAKGCDTGRDNVKSRVFWEPANNRDIQDANTRTIANLGREHAEGRGIRDATWSGGGASYAGM